MDADRPYRSDDGGATWNLVATGYPPGQGIYALAVSPADADRVLLGSYGSQPIWLTTDGGVQWSAASGVGATIRSIAWDASTPGLVFAAAADGLYRSTDSGVTWGHVSAAGTDDKKGVAVSVAAPGVIIVGATNNNLRSTDGRVTFGPVFTTPALRQISWPVNDPNRLYAIGSDDHVYRSTDQGTIFWPTADPPGIDDGAIFALEAFPFSSLDLVSATTGYGCHPFGSTKTNIHRSTDGGDTWQTIYTDAECDIANPQDIAIHPTDPSRIWVAESASAERGVLCTSNGGSTWGPRIDGICGYPVNRIDGAADGTLWVRAGRHLARTSGVSPAWSSLGLQFMGVQRPSPGLFETSSGNPYQLLEFAEDTSGDVIHPIFGRDRGLYRSTHGGVYYSYRSTLPNTGPLVMEPADPDRLWYASRFTAGSVHLSTDGGLSWALARSVDVGSGEVKGVSWDPATAYGFFLTTASGVLSNHPSYEPSNAPFVSGNAVYFSAPRGRVYVATETSGMWEQVIAPPVGVAGLPEAPDALTVAIVPNPFGRAARSRRRLPRARPRGRRGVDREGAPSAVSGVSSRAMNGDGAGALARRAGPVVIS